MVQQEKDILLHRLTHNTNLSVPYSDYVSSTTYPEQNTTLLGTIVPLKFRNMYVVETKDPLTGPESIDPHDIYEIDCLIVRCDKGKPYRMIGVSEDYHFILLTDSRYYKEQVNIYPIQYTGLIGTKCKDQYPAQYNFIDGIILRADQGEPFCNIIAELIYETGEVRFVTGDECFSKIINESNIDLLYSHETYYKGKEFIRMINDRKSILEGVKIYGNANS